MYLIYKVEDNTSPPLKLLWLHPYKDAAECRFNTSIPKVSTLTFLTDKKKTVKKELVLIRTRLFPAVHRMEAVFSVLSLAGRKEDIKAWEVLVIIKPPVF